MLAALFIYLEDLNVYPLIKHASFLADTRIFKITNKGNLMDTFEEVPLATRHFLWPQDIF